MVAIRRVLIRDSEKVEHYLPAPFSIEYQPQFFMTKPEGLPGCHDCTYGTYLTLRRGTAIWSIDIFQPVTLPKWTEDEAGTAATKTVDLDAILGGRAVQRRTPRP